MKLFRARTSCKRYGVLTFTRPRVPSIITFLLSGNTLRRILRSRNIFIRYGAWDINSRNDPCNTRVAPYMNRPLFLLFIFISVTAPAQNLVMNPGFEDTTRAPSVGYNQKGAGTPLVKGWWVATSGTSDYYNSDRSRNYAATDPKSELVPKAHSGQGRAGFIAYTGAGTWKNIWSEYLESQLIQPLQAGKKYCVSFYVKLDSGSGYSASDLGLCFSGNEIVSYRHFALRNEPQVVCRDVKLLRDRSGWSKICGYYTAHGGERFITIGCFEFNGLCPTEKKLERLKYPTFKKMAYYYLDDVDVHEVISNENCCEARNAGVVALRNFVLLVDASGSMHDS